jgi:hypothetical protein
VILWGSAATPLAHALFIPTRLREIRTSIEVLKIGGLRFLTLDGQRTGRTRATTRAISRAAARCSSAPMSTPTTPRTPRG